MEEDQSTNSQSSGSKKGIIIAVIAVVVILAIAGGGFMFLNKNKENSPTEMTETENTNTQAISSPIPTSSTSTEVSPSASTFKDGTYSATGSYNTPGGVEVIGVKLTIKDGSVTAAEVTQMGKSPTAKVKQADFAENFNVLVVGKSIDGLNLTKVSGSSLTPKGFNDAVTQIKAQAQS